LGTTQQSLHQANVSTYLEGLDIGQLRTCLTGVQQAYGQIAAHDNNQAAADLSGVSGACSSVDGSTGDGLVYPFDFPDPFVLRVGADYFAYGTNSVGGSIQIIESTDLLHWSATGNALVGLPTWAVAGATWAPSVVQLGSTCVLYYSTVVSGSGGGEMCISAATSTQPQGPFVDNSTAPVVCQPALGGSIDPAPFVDTNGTPYLVWKTDGTTHQPARLWSQQLAPTGTAVIGSGPSNLLTADLGWEDGVIEAPDLVVTSGRYLLFYSGNNWDTANYAVGVASCSGPVGPCTEPWTQPILSGDADEVGTGGESVFTDASGTPWIAFHAWLPAEVGYPHSRGLYLRKLNLSGSEPLVEPSS
jgi:beta-xylosidase